MCFWAVLLVVKSLYHHTIIYRKVPIAKAPSLNSVIHHSCLFCRGSLLKATLWDQTGIVLPETR